MGLYSEEFVDRGNSAVLPLGGGGAYFPRNFTSRVKGYFCILRYSGTEITRGPTDPILDTGTHWQSRSFHLFISFYAFSFQMCHRACREVERSRGQEVKRSRGRGWIKNRNYILLFHGRGWQSFSRRVCYLHDEIEPLEGSSFASTTENSLICPPSFVGGSPTFLLEE